MDRKCVRCKKEIIDKRNFLGHIAKCAVGIAKPLKCSLCPERFNLEQKLNAHIQREHRRMERYTLQVSKFALPLRQSVQSSKDFRNMIDLRPLIHEFEQSFAEHAPKEHDDRVHFVYILIDTIVAQNWLLLSKYLTKVVVWERFLRSIFYVGMHSCRKGERYTYSYLKDAVTHYNEPPDKEYTLEPHIQRVVRIWQKGQGVISLEICKCNSRKATMSRQAAIIQCLGSEQLSNKDFCAFFAPTDDWDLKKISNLGIVTLYEAHIAYLKNNDHEILPWNVICNDEHTAMDDLLNGIVEIDDEVVEDVEAEEASERLNYIVELAEE